MTAELEFYSAATKFALPSAAMFRGDYFDEPSVLAYPIGLDLVDAGTVPPPKPRVMTRYGTQRNAVSHTTAPPGEVWPGNALVTDPRIRSAASRYRVVQLTQSTRDLLAEGTNQPDFAGVLDVGAMTVNRGAAALNPSKECGDQVVSNDTAEPKGEADPLEGYEQFKERNWDGYDAEPITAETLRYARCLLRVMPDTFGPPDIAPSGDGSIGLEWVPDDAPLDRLFLDIGPGEEWRAYWKRRNGEFGRLPGTGFDSQTRHILQRLFADLSGHVAVGR